MGIVGCVIGGEEGKIVFEGWVVFVYCCVVD